MPSGQSRQTQAASSCYSSFSGPSPLALISWSSLQLTFVSYIFIHAGNSWASHSLTLSLINLLLGSLDPCSTAPPPSLGCSEAPPNKQHHQSELWAVGLYSRGNLPSGGASVYAGRCPDRETPPDFHVDEQDWVRARQKIHLNFRFPQIQSSIF